MINPELDQGGEQLLIRQQDIFHEKLCLAQVYIDERFNNDNYTEELGVLVAKDLDKVCPYLDHPVMMSGRAFVPIVDMEAMNIVGEQWEDGVMLQGQHEGVDIIYVEDGRPCLTQRLRHGTVTYHPQQTVGGQLNLYSYFTNEANITLMLGIESIFDPYYFGQHDAENNPMAGFKVLAERSEELVMLYQDEQFRGLEHVHQLQVINDFIEETSQESSIGELRLVIEASYAYTTQLMPEEKLGMATVDLERSVISGTCLAIDSLERLQLPLRPIKSDEELLDKDAGLCLVLDPDEDVRQGLKLNSSQVLFIPMSGQYYEMELIDLGDD